MLDIAVGHAQQQLPVTTDSPPAGSADIDPTGSAPLMGDQDTVLTLHPPGRPIAAPSHCPGLHTHPATRRGHLDGPRRGGQAQLLTAVVHRGLAFGQR